MIECEKKRGQFGRVCVFLCRLQETITSVNIRLIAKRCYDRMLTAWQAERLPYNGMIKRGAYR